MYEAQQAYYYGFPENLAIASVTSNAARVIGLDYRIGYIREGKLTLGRRDNLFCSYWVIYQGYDAGMSGRCQRTLV